MRFFRHRDREFDNFMATVERRKAMGKAIGELRIAKTVLPDTPKPQSQHQETTGLPDEVTSNPPAVQVETQTSDFTLLQ
ncbi:MAG TPA: hypothetical protein VFI84_03400 [Candidatus Saccharimonadales bacterium]|nr:hypothetical protein [Candidatus Saccharimonadales bacterium]